MKFSYLDWQSRNVKIFVKSKNLHSRRSVKDSKSSHSSKSFYDQDKNKVNVLAKRSGTNFIYKHIEASDRIFCRK